LLKPSAGQILRPRYSSRLFLRLACPQRGSHSNGSGSHLADASFRGGCAA